MNITGSEMRTTFLHNQQSYSYAYLGGFAEQVRSANKNTQIHKWTNKAYIIKKNNLLSNNKLQGIIIKALVKIKYEIKI